MLRKALLRGADRGSARRSDRWDGTADFPGERGTSTGVGGCPRSKGGGTLGIQGRPVDATGAQAACTSNPDRIPSPKLGKGLDDLTITDAARLGAGDLCRMS